MKPFVTATLIGLRLFWRSGRGILWILSFLSGLLGPVVLYHLAKMASHGNLKAGGHTVYLIILGFVVPAFVFPLGTMLLGLSAIRDDEDSGAALALVLRPIPRWKLLVGRYVAGVVSLWLPLALLTPVAWLTLEPKIRLAGFKELAVQMAGLLPAAAAAMAVGIFISLLFKKPLLPLILWGFGWENAVAYLPGHIKDLTVQFHLRTLIGRMAEGRLASFFARSESAFAALVGLFMLAVIPLGLAIWLYHRRQYPGGGD